MITRYFLQVDIQMCILYATYWNFMRLSKAYGNSATYVVESMIQSSYHSLKYTLLLLYLIIQPLTMPYVCNIHAYMYGYTILQRSSKKVLFLQQLKHEM